MNVERVRVFITGATGFLGGALARTLARENAEVHALGRPLTDRRQLQGVPIIWHEGDVTVRESLSGVLQGADWVIHAAGRLGQSGIAESAYRCVNVDGTRNVMAEALATGNGVRVLHLSSPGVLGPTGREPRSEDAPFAPTNPYERSKAAAERVALEFAAKGLPVVIARPGFIYGPGDRHVLGLFRAVQRGRFFYIGGGGHLCQPTFVADAVAGMLACLRRGRIGEVYHLEGPRTVSFRELGEAIAAALGVRQPRWDVPRWFAMLGATALEVLARVSRRNPPLGRTAIAFFSEDRVFSWQKAHRELGYTPQHELATGVPITVAWYRQHGWL
jgi:nucleoside-diphosphate-sugar epimerase